MITRIHAYNKLSKCVGTNLLTLTEKHNVTVVGTNGHINKGWKGLALEKEAGITPNSRKAPNGLGFEIKSVPYYLDDGVWRPKETMAITMLHQDEVLNEDFFDSHVWEKVKSLIFCVCSWHGTHSMESTLLDVMSLDFLTTDNTIGKMRDDYDLIRKKLKEHGFQSLTSSDGELLQTRTKGRGHGSTSRAFYTRKPFLEAICPPFSIADAEAA